MGLFVVGAHSRDEATSVATNDPLFQVDQTTVEVINGTCTKSWESAPFDTASLQATYPGAI